jgi:hypothetical protein
MRGTGLTKYNRLFGEIALNVLSPAVIGDAYLAEPEKICEADIGEGPKYETLRIGD